MLADIYFLEERKKNVKNWKWNNNNKEYPFYFHQLPRHRLGNNQWIEDKSIEISNMYHIYNDLEVSKT